MELPAPADGSDCMKPPLVDRMPLGVDWLLSGLDSAGEPLKARDSACPASESPGRGTPGCSCGGAAPSPLPPDRSILAQKSSPLDLSEHQPRKANLESCACTRVHPQKESLLALCRFYRSIFFKTESLFGKQTSSPGPTAKGSNLTPNCHVSNRKQADYNAEK